MLKHYLLPSLKTLGTLLVGALLTFVLWESYYYLQVLRWVDNIRISQAIQQAAQQAQQQQHAPQPQPPPPARDK